MESNRSDKPTRIGTELSHLLNQFFIDSGLSESKSPRAAQIRSELETLKRLDDPDELKDTCDLIIEYIKTLKKSHSAQNDNVFVAMYKDWFAANADENKAEEVKALATSMITYYTEALETIEPREERMALKAKAQELKAQELKEQELKAEAQKRETMEYSKEFLGGKASNYDERKRAEAKKPQPPVKTISAEVRNKREALKKPQEARSTPNFLATQPRKKLSTEEKPDLKERIETFRQAKEARSTPNLLLAKQPRKKLTEEQKAKAKERIEAARQAKEAGSTPDLLAAQPRKKLSNEEKANLKERIETWRQAKEARSAPELLAKQPGRKLTTEEKAILKEKLEARKAKKDGKPTFFAPSDSRKQAEAAKEKKEPEVTPAIKGRFTPQGGSQDQ